ncbi:MAG: hypothetical protein QM802_16040 [Agriterribacter sp.]
MPDLEPSYIRNSRWRLLTYAIGLTGFFVTTLYDAIFNHWKSTGGGSSYQWIFIIIFFLLALFFIRQYRTHPVEIEITMDDIMLNGEGTYNWQDIQHVGTEYLGGDTPTNHLVLKLYTGKKISKNLSDLEIDDKELLKLIHKYVEARKEKWQIDHQ